jgi:hypothetical protein
MSRPYILNKKIVCAFIGVWSILSTTHFLLGFEMAKGGNTISVDDVNNLQTTY